MLTTVKRGRTNDAASLRESVWFGDVSDSLIKTVSWGAVGCDLRSHLFVLASEHDVINAPHWHSDPASILE